MMMMKKKYVTDFLNARKPYSGRGSARDLESRWGAYSVPLTLSWWGGARCPLQKSHPALGHLTLVLRFYFYAHVLRLGVKKSP